MSLKNIPKNLPYHCEICDIDCRKKNIYEKHLLTSKHKIREKSLCSSMVNVQKSPFLPCDICNITTRNKKDYQKHLLTAKHIKNASVTVPSNEKSPIFTQKIYKCKNCNNEYACASGLWRHKQKCKENKENEELEVEEEVETETHDEPNAEVTMQNIANMITPELVVILIQQNKDMQKIMMEQTKSMMESMMDKMMELAKNGGHNTTNNIQNNKSFNMNFFLNETCKNAMNMSDFVKNLIVTTHDFEQTGILGYAEGISRIIENGLLKLDICERPIHCSDVKRETIYIKDNDKWEKDDENKTKLLSVVKQVGIKNINMISQWQKEHPGWSDSDSKEDDRYLKYVFNSMCGGTTEEINHNYGKIMRNISRITIVDKQDAMNALSMK
jgi:hypothetical protein